MKVYRIYNLEEETKKDTVRVFYSLKDAIRYSKSLEKRYLTCPPKYYIEEIIICLGILDKGLTKEEINKRTIKANDNIISDLNKVQVKLREELHRLRFAKKDNKC